MVSTKAEVKVAPKTVRWWPKVFSNLFLKGNNEKAKTAPVANASKNGFKTYPMPARAIMKIINNPICRCKLDANLNLNLYKKGHHRVA